MMNRTHWMQLQIYDVHDVGIRAFGSKPAPLRKAVLSVTDAIKRAVYCQSSTWRGALLTESCGLCRFQHIWCTTLLFSSPFASGLVEPASFHCGCFPNAQTKSCASFATTGLSCSIC
jgi:hypothetical protein